MLSSIVNYIVKSKHLVLFILKALTVTLTSSMFYSSTSQTAKNIVLSSSFLSSSSLYFVEECSFSMWYFFSSRIVKWYIDGPWLTMRLWKVENCVSWNASKSHNLLNTIVWHHNALWIMGYAPWVERLLSVSCVWLQLIGVIRRYCVAIFKLRQLEIQSSISTDHPVLLHNVKPDKVGW